jgi:predicted ATPase
VIHRIRIRNYKSLRDVDLTLEPLTVLFGPNAAGKSNFVDALQLLSRIVSSRNLREAFEPPYRGRPLESFTFPEGGLSALMRQESTSFSIEVDLKLSPQTINAVDREIALTKPNGRGAGRTNAAVGSGSHIHHELLRYRIEIGASPATGKLYVIDECVAPLDKNWMPKSKPKPFLEKQGERLHLRMEGQSHPAYFDCSLDYAILSRPHYVPHHPHIHALKLEIEGWYFYYFEPRERMRAPGAVQEVRHIGLMGEHLAAFLHTLRVQQPKQFANIEKALHVLIPSISGIHTEVNKMGEVELTLVERNSGMPARIVSEGTLRVLGLLSLSGVNDAPTLIGFEEPENGVHPRRIADIAGLLENLASDETQVIATTHSVVLPDHLNPNSLVTCRKLEGVTSLRKYLEIGRLFLKGELEDALNDDGSEPTPVSRRLLRGDFDA